MSTPPTITITIGENGESVTGEHHLSTLRDYITRLSTLEALMAPYIALPLAEYTPRVQERCQAAVRSFALVLSATRSVLGISREVYNSLTAEQTAELVLLMAQLEAQHKVVVVMLAKLKVVLVVCDDEDE